MASMTPDELRAVLDAHAKWLLGDGSSTRATLRGADLRGADLSWANLRRANLRGADLSWANLRDADLRGADLSWANLHGAKLRGADLSWANLRDADLHAATLDVCRIDDGEYEATLCLGTDGPELAYGCERHPLAHWEENVEEITRRHISADAVAAKVAQLRALFAYLRTIPQPTFSEEMSRG